MVDGSMGFIGPTALLNFKDTFTEGPTRSALRRSGKAANLLQRVPVAQSLNGDWRTQPLNPGQMPEIIARAERLLTLGGIIIGDDALVTAGDVIGFNPTDDRSVTYQIRNTVPPGDTR